MNLDLVKVKRAALRTAFANSSLGKVSLVSRGNILVLVLGARLSRDGVNIQGMTAERTVSSAGFAREVVARYARDLAAWPDKTPVQTLDLSIAYQEAALRFRSRQRRGLRSRS